MLFFLAQGKKLPDENCYILSMPNRFWIVVEVLIWSGCDLNPQTIVWVVYRSKVCPYKAYFFKNGASNGCFLPRGFNVIESRQNS